ncbi:MAG: E3 binding domain-containing protein, partial [Candidatus Regiella insecticola]|nr:E3 binding domain-containing protein [Candidatus Regiella insecticola]
AAGNVEEKAAVETAPIATDNSHIDKTKIDNNEADHSQIANTDDFTENSAYVHATPVIRRLAREVGINLAKVTATGRKGRILREDLQRYVEKVVNAAESGAVTTGGLPGML